MLFGALSVLVLSVFRFAFATELQGAPIISNDITNEVIRFTDESEGFAEEEYVMDIRNATLEDIIDYHDPETAWVTDVEGEIIGFDDLAEDLVEIDFVGTDRRKEERIINAIIKNGDKRIEIPFEFSEERLLYIAEGVLQRTGRDCSAFRRFRQRYRGVESIKQITIPFNYGYNHVVMYVLNRITMPDRFAYMLIKECDAVELLVPFADALRPLINLYTTADPLLVHAVRFNRYKIVEYFVNHLGANIHIRTLPENGVESCLHVLNSNSDVRMLNFLLDHGADYKVLNVRNETIVLTWVKNDVSILLYERLLARIGKAAMLKLVNIRSIFRDYPLTLALTKRRYRVLLLLVRLGADVNVTVPAGFADDPFEHYLQALSAFIFGSRNFINRPPLNWAVIKRDFLALRILLKEAKMPFTALNDFGETALIEAVREQDYDSLKIILESGRLNPAVDVSVSGESALIIATRFGCEEIVELLQPYFSENRADGEVELITFNEKK